MTKPRRLFVDTEFGQMHLRISHSKKNKSAPLICLHMTPQSSRYFSNFMDVMSDDRVVVAPDYPGYGESDLPLTGPDVSIADYARSIWQALDELQIGKIDLLGHHTGSKVAIEMALNRPNAVGDIVLVSALLSASKNIPPERDLKSATLDESGERFVQVWEIIKAFRGPGMGLETMIEAFAESIRNNEASEWGYRAAAAYNGVFAQGLSMLPHRVVVFNPGDDLYEQTPKLLEYLQNGFLIDKPEWGHGLWDAHTHDVAHAIKVVLDKSIDTNLMNAAVMVAD